VKILLDENLPHKLRRALGERDVVTVGYMGWNGSGMANYCKSQRAAVSAF
jgi:hypothetical protein